MHEFTHKINNYIEGSDFQDKIYDYSIDETLSIITVGEGCIDLTCSTKTTKEF